MLVMGSCPKPTSTPAVCMPVQKQLTQGLAVQVHKQVYAHTQGGFSYPVVFLFSGGKIHMSPADTIKLLPQYEFLNPFLLVAECAFDNSLPG